MLGVLLFGRYLRRSEVLTVPEFFGKRFDSRALQAVAGGTVLIGIGAYLVAVTQGMSLLVSDLLGINFGIALLVVWLALHGVHPLLRLPWRPHKRHHHVLRIHGRRDSWAWSS